MARRRKGTDTWHFCKNCSNWPTVDYDEGWAVARTGGEKCNECVAAQKANNCTPG